ncbi:MAG: methyltransferase family protein [Thermoleophilia bacterium]
MKNVDGTADPLDGTADPKPPAPPTVDEPTSRPPWWRGTRGEWYVVAQVIIFGLILVGPRPAGGLPSWTEPYATAATVIGAALTAAGATLSIWGVFALGTNLSVLPHPKEGSRFVASGPYRFVRNPIYSGLILGSFGLALILHSWLSLVYALALLILFDLKTRREERWLRERYPGYADYQRRVEKLLPWVW